MQQQTDFLSVQYIHSPGIAGLYGRCGGSIFGFLRNLQTVFYSGCTNLHSRQDRTNIFSTSSSAFVILSLWDIKQFNWHEIISYCSSDLHFSEVQWCLAMVICLFATCIFFSREMPPHGWMWCLTSVIPALWDAEVSRWPEIRSSRPDWPTWCNPISTKDTKNWPGMVAHACNPSYLGGWGRRIAKPRRWRLRWAKIHPILGNQSETLSQRKEINKNK